MKKTVIARIVLILILSFLVIRYFRTWIFINNLETNAKDIKGQLNQGFNDNNFPVFAKDFIYKQKDSIPELSEKTMYESSAQKEVLDIIEKNLPDNLNEFQTKLAPSILELMKIEKNNTYPSAEETDNYPERPTGKTINAISYYWPALSLEFAKKGDFKTSLLLAHGLFYFSRELELSYGNGGEFLYKVMSSTYNKRASKAILVWASHPHPECQELSKIIARDILKLVDSNIPVTRNLEFFKYLINQYLVHFSKKTTLVGKNVLNSSYYNELFEFYINTPLKFEEKPFFEIKKEYEEHYSKIKKIGDSGELMKSFPNYLINPEKAIVQATFNNLQPASGVYFVKHHNEDSLGYMEFAAIALFINAYYCQNNKLPASIEELEKWSGVKMPVSRFDNQPYVIDNNGKHTLSFKHLGKIYNDNQLYFDFSN